MEPRTGLVNIPVNYEGAYFQNQLNMNRATKPLYPNTTTPTVNNMISTMSPTDIALSSTSTQPYISGLQGVDLTKGNPNINPYSYVNEGLTPGQVQTNERMALTAQDQANQVNAAGSPSALDYANIGLGIGQLGLGLASYEDTRRYNKEARNALKENLANAREARQFRQGLAGAFA